MPIVAITGGGRGIGKAAAVAFAEEGYDVAIIDTRLENAEETAHRIEALGRKAVAVQGDVASEQDVKQWVNQTTRELGRIDALMNNAGIGISGSMLDIAVSDFDRVIAVNLRGTFLCSREAANVMKRTGGGTIVNIASTRALMSEADTEAYAASKGGIVALTHAMAISLGRFGIRVNAISPGWIETSDNPRHSAEDLAQHPVGRVGVPEDIAQACVYLAGPKSGFITGQNIIIDGGMTVKMIYV